MPAAHDSLTAAPGPWAARAAERLREIGLGSWLAVMSGNVLYLVFGFLANWILANRLPPADFGLLSLAMAVLAVAQETCGSGIDLAMVRLAAEHALREPARAGATMRAAFRAKLVLSLLAGLVLWLLPDSLVEGVFHDRRFGDLVPWVAVGLVGSALYFHVLARLQVAERFNAYTLYRGLNPLLRVAMLVVLACVAGLTLVSAVAVSMASFALAFALAALVPGVRLPTASGPGGLGEVGAVLRFARWVMLSHFLFALYSRVDMFVLGRFRSASEVGVYSIAWNLTFLMDLCTYSVILSLLPKVSRISDPRELSGHLRKTLALSGLLAVFLLPLYFLASPLLSTLFPGYPGAVPVFRVLFWGPLVTLLVHPLYLVLYQRHRVALLAGVNLTLVVVAAAAAFALVPRHGTVGAAWAMVGARTWSCLLIAFLVWRELRAMEDERVAPALSPEPGP